MTLVSVQMWRVVCSADKCESSPQDDSEYFAWMDPDQPVDEALDADWYVTRKVENAETVHLCPDHAPRCKVEGCAVMLRDDEFGGLCEDHWIEREEQKENVDG